MRELIQCGRRDGEDVYIPAVRYQEYGRFHIRRVRYCLREKEREVRWEAERVEVQERIRTGREGAEEVP